MSGAHRCIGPERKHCSFCGRGGIDVLVLVAGVAALICDQCSDDAAEIIMRKRARQRAAPVCPGDIGPLPLGTCLRRDIHLAILGEANDALGDTLAIAKALRGLALVCDSADACGKADAVAAGIEILRADIQRAYLEELHPDPPVCPVPKPEAA